MTMIAPKAIDFTVIDYDRDPMPIPAMIDRFGHAKVTSRKQLRSRARRKKQGFDTPEYKRLYKPVEEWDAEELARGRPRNRDGGFRGRSPHWITRELHEEAMTRFRQVIRDGMNSRTNSALEVIQMILDDNERDENNKPIISASTKLDAAKFLVEHVLGKPKQHIETDISVRLQGLLATSVVNGTGLPAPLGAKELTSPRDGAIDVEGWEEGEEDDE